MGSTCCPAEFQQKRGLAVLAAAADRGDKMPDEPACEFRHEQHGRATGADFARSQAGDGAARTLSADGLRVLQLAPVARGAVPVVALHVFARSGEDHTAERMRGGRIAADETMRVAVDMQPLMSANRCTLGIVDARVESQRGRLAGFGDLDGAVRRHVPGMRKVEVLGCACHQSGVRETGTGVFGGKSGNTAGLGDRRAHRLC